jgi:lipoprotein LprG
MQTMPLGRRSTATILAAIVLLVSLVAGCSKSDSGQSSAPLPDAAGLLKQSAQTTRDVKSAHLELTVQGKLPGLPVKTLSGDLTNVPAVAAKGHTKITLGGDDIEADFVVLNGTIYGSLDPGTWTDFGAAANVYDASVILNPDVGLANILSNFTNPKAEGRENINGIQTVKITGQVNPDAVVKIIPKLTPNGGVNATVWIREDGNHDLVQAKLEPSSGNSIQMTLSKWNEPVTVEKPPGV